jgi:3-methyl-2-oxobutanoate hydroxymethyltransferase
MDKVTIPALHQMKRDRQKIVAVVAWDFQIAQIADRAGVEIISVGDSVGMNLWGRSDPSEVTVDEMIIVCKAVRRGTKRALVSCDFPFGPLQAGTDTAVKTAIRIVEEGGADMVKLDGAAEFPEAVTAVARAGIPVFAQFERNRQTPESMTSNLVADAMRLEAAGASLLDFKHSGSIAGPAVVSAVATPVIGGMGGGPWLDGRIRMVHAAIGYAASALSSQTENYANVARITLDALTAYADDVRAERQIKPG